MASVEMVMLDEGKVSLPYVATLHGSHEAMDIPDESIARWARQIHRLVYTADRNLESFRRVGVDEAGVRKFRNAMPVDDQPFPKSRAELGIPEAAVVFSLVARGEKGKGWPQAVRAFQQLEQRHPDRDMALLMVGAGEETEAGREAAGDNPRIRFLGLQQRIHGLYRISDVALAPTRFKGESFPLCLIQAMQVGTPVIATDIGEIRAMIEVGDHAAGLILPRLEDDDAFVAGIVAAMERMLDPALRSSLAEGARALGSAYSMDALAEDYIELYSEVVRQH
jgi:glycosyltransferase involved in cell wall biosynthesis